MRVAVASDHAGYKYKELAKSYLQEKGHEVVDYGTHSEDRTDYPDFAHMVAEAVSRGEAARGLLVCGSCQGIAMAANRHKGVRASVPWNEETARLSREHNDSNVLALGARTLPEGEPEKILKAWLETPFGQGRHERRVRTIDRE